VPGGPDEENAARHLPAQALEALRLLEKLHHLLQIALGGLQARDVLEGDVDRSRLVELAALVLGHAAEWVAGAEHRLRPARHPQPEPDDERPRQEREQDLQSEGLLLAVHVDLHALLTQQRKQRRIVGGERRVHLLQGAAGHRLGALQRGVEGFPAHDHRLDLPIGEQRIELGVSDRCRRRLVQERSPRPRPHEHERERHEQTSLRRQPGRTRAGRAGRIDLHLDKRGRTTVRRR
jgi:hypothetical protein